ncbi:uncharacterized protein CDV56_100730 [Aspergillus thermomutatus]|uniref:Uncharacterized protein n=1 Tax=Aspergillus thermomutatus TaxID=41047 RepID=A0A397G7D4_ASPTH|nr:uncharacterized protein CDV56_100730 [Aspergillus thermomutatus]RHZ45929.1 hypothetical protein CDV56_100730 [Aspergillus thermomutatus]
MFGARQRNWYRDIPHQAFSSILPVTTSPICLSQMENHTRSPAQFPPVQRLSPRLPDRSPRLNMADRIERDLHEDGLRAWGFVIYRCTYQSNTAWVEFMRRLLANTKDTLESGGGLDLLDNLALTVIEDSGSLDGATTAVIRQHFQQWVATAVQEEPGTTSPGLQWSQRYKYCLQITQDVLDSVLTDEEEGGFVRLIRRDWGEYDPYDQGERVEDEQEAIEGCTLEDVGWMKVPFDGVMVVPWYYLRGAGWETEYRRPPEIASYC